MLFSQMARLRGVSVLSVLSRLVVLVIYVQGEPSGQVSFHNAPSSEGVSKSSENVWDLSREPSMNSTGRWIFDNANSFLKLWPNTRLRNGHNLVPGVIPTGTLLYHGTEANEVPNEPEWASVDPEHSYMFCSVYNVQECWHLTLVVTSPLKVLYLDGNGAAKMWGGSMDSQDILVWGGIQPNRTFDEYPRIADMCKWGKDYGIDAFVRMEMDFEVMLCDFTTKLEVVSLLRLKTVGSELSSHQTTLEPDRVLEAGHWHDRFPSEQRIKLDYTRFISFYDTSLFPTLNLHRQGQDRWDHRLKDITPDELDTLRRTLAENLQGHDWGVSQSGVDWPTLLMAIEQRYSERLSVLRYILFELATNPERKLEDVLKQAHRHIRGMITPYLLDSMHPTRSSHRSGEPVTTSNLQWAAAAFEECATIYTRYLEKPAVFSSLSHSEKLLLGAAREALTEICRVLVGMWAEGTERGLSAYPSAIISGDEDSVNRPSAPLLDLADSWRSRTQGLMNWLDWSSWVTCQPECSFEEMCSLPTWPRFKHWPQPIPNDDNTERIPEPGPDDDWYHPTPKCIRRIE